MEPDLKNLRIKRGSGLGLEGDLAPASRWSTRWIVTGVLVFAVLGVASTIWKRANAA